jgi:hypothetical protein
LGTTHHVARAYLIGQLRPVVGKSGVAGAEVPPGGALTIPDGEVSAVWALARVAASIHAPVTKHAMKMRAASRKRATLDKDVDDSVGGFRREFQDKCAPSRASKAQ